MIASLSGNPRITKCKHIYLLLCILSMAPIIVEPSAHPHGFFWTFLVWHRLAAGPPKCGLFMRRALMMTTARRNLTSHLPKQI
ncbi:hypothetical protein F5B17DRAFT_408795 [Nemania serpens]|nr:hypothetical protein F5B17DRAFT_408795 [Nemania serpens]